MNIECHACVGGTNVREDMAKLQEGVQVVVGTPGRVYDMINRRALKADSIKIFCLDEADEMLSRGFKDQIYEGECFVGRFPWFAGCMLMNRVCSWSGMPSCTFTASVSEGTEGKEVMKAMNE